MIHKGIATFGLDYGKCPPWLFERMVKLGRQIVEVIVAEYGPDEFIKRISDPAWFQSLGTVLAFDWNASGLTTILTAALKEAIREKEDELGIYIAGGKGKTSRKTPEQIHIGAQVLNIADSQAEKMVYNSKMSAKVDSSLLQDGFTLYHHAFFFSKNGAWSVVQQGMNEEKRSARRYHWFSEHIEDLIVEPHSGISSQTFAPTLDLTARASDGTRKISTELVQQSFKSLMKDVEVLYKHSSHLSQTIKLKSGQQTFSFTNLEKREFYEHPVETENFKRSAYLEKILKKVTELKPKNYEELVSLEGVGAKTLRSLSLVAEVIYGAHPSYTDPARYSFAHGGKDATPYPVDKKTYDTTIGFFNALIPKLKIEAKEKDALKRKLDKTDADLLPF